MATPPATSPVDGPDGVATSRTPASVGNGRPSRVVIPSLNIDLPVIRGNDSFPLCDVALYHTMFVRPGHVGSTYIYAHAQRGMFLPMLRASLRNNGAEMVGEHVEVYTDDGRLHLYEIYRVKRHAINFDLAYNVGRGEHRLVLQTSEGTRGHRPKLQVAARPVGVYEATAAEALPRARPRRCG